MNTLHCEICNKGFDEGVPLYRANEKGIPGIWRCEEHLEKAPDPEVKHIVDVISHDTSVADNKGESDGIVLGSEADPEVAEIPSEETRDETDSN